MITNLRIWTGEPNFGDVLSISLIKKISGKSLTIDCYSKEKSLVAIGSILHFAKAGDVIWGTGWLGAHRPEFNKICQPKLLDIRALRGPLTATRLEWSGPLGDPAITLPFFYTPEVSPTHKLGYAPHWADTRISVPECHTIELLNSNPKEVINEICSCNLVVTSSLHVMIVCDVYGIPYVPMHHTASKESKLKYQDYMATTDRVYNPLILTAHLPTSVLSKYTVKPKWSRERADALLSVFPHEVLGNANSTTAQ